MFRPLALFIGLRYTKAKRKNGFISFISLISMIGLTLGVAVLITVLSVMNGFDREIKSRILGMIPQAAVMSSDIISDWQPLAERIKTENKDVQAIAPFIQLQGMLTAQGQVAGIMVTGIEPEYEKQVSIVDEHMTAGSIDNLKAGEFGIVLGESMVYSMGLQLGDQVTLVLPEATPSAAGVIPRFKRFTLVGVFHINKEIDDVMGFVQMRDAGVMLRLPEGAQGLRMKLDDIFTAPKVANNAVNIDPMRLHSTDWTQTHGSLFGAIQMEKAMIGLLLFLIVVVAAFNIVSSLVMLVTDKKSDIAILKTFGASPKLIMQVFMVQGMIIGVIGTVVGTALGVTLAVFVNDIVVGISSVFGVSLFDGSVYPVDFLPSEVQVLDMVMIMTASFLLSFLMTIYPALRASRIEPAQTLRYE
ncbi:lipoprotein-releasing ABC transporter permease subunit [Moraxella sp. FZLJ2107]|uniref:lipoprotein-releasing ABC transporter permease subunit n=1 Tax=unclassified Moraxella TaxID=2685852 RepID=UPI0020C88118|nr:MULTISPECIES: lipoprotein-releasing ABC transporter permease subunit [unclassified Moraxella]UTO05129.1 lipoprotein-releasing ABC transporter permease subunit [Moraxella sp. FZLJ2107]UTO21864.1 lipoprotein-releasing ABC transporter permease subunit [Moraxella sp. FZLJ2109]